MANYICSKCGASNINEECEECGYIPEDEYKSYERRFTQE